MNRVDAILRQIDQRVDKRARELIDEHHRNARPRGNTPMTLGAGDAGVPLIVQAGARCHTYLTYPVRYDRLILLTDPGTPGTAEVDVWVQGPQDLAPASLFNGTLPTLDDGSGGPAYVKITLVDLAWGWKTELQPDSSVWLYVTAARGIETLSVNFVLKCL